MNGSQFTEEDINKNKNIAAVAHIPILFFLPLVSCPDSAFGKFHANQGLLLLLVYFAASIVGFIPILGWIIAPIVGLAAFIWFIVSLLDALNGGAKPMPLIGHIQLIK
jgi:uncharacterized membrane protein